MSGSYTLEDARRAHTQLEHHLGRQIPKMENDVPLRFSRDPDGLWLFGYRRLASDPYDLAYDPIRDCALVIVNGETQEWRNGSVDAAEGSTQ